MIRNYTLYVFAGYLFLWNSMVFEVHKSNRAKSLMNMISQLFHSITIFPHRTIVLQTHRAEVNNRNPRNVGRHFEQHLTRPQSSLIFSIWRGRAIGRHTRVRERVVQVVDSQLLNYTTVFFFLTSFIIIIIFI